MAYNKALAERLELPIQHPEDDYTVDTILSNYWYDDGAMLVEPADEQTSMRE